MVTCDEDNWHFETEDKAGKDVVQQADGLWRGHRAIINVTGNEYGVWLTILNEGHEVIQYVRLILSEMHPMEEPSQMPVSGMDEPHRTSRSPQGQKA
jgi:hypothetical protein